MSSGGCGKSPSPKRLYLLFSFRYLQANEIMAELGWCSLAADEGLTAASPHPERVGRPPLLHAYGWPSLVAALTYASFNLF